jgi:hypothetical protein
MGVYLMDVPILMLMLQNDLLTCSFRVFEVLAIQYSGKMP